MRPHSPKFSFADSPVEKFNCSRESKENLERERKKIEIEF